MSAPNQIALHLKAILLVSVRLKFERIPFFVGGIVRACQERRPLGRCP